MRKYHVAKYGYYRLVFAFTWDSPLRVRRFKSFEASRRQFRFFSFSDFVLWQYCSLGESDPVTLGLVDREVLQ